MKTRLLLAAVFVLSLSGVSFADHHEMGDMKADVQAAADTTVQAAQEVVAEAGNAVAAVEVGNKICPVEGGKIEEGKSAKIEYNGKIYNLCCAMCSKDFNKDPEKYSKKAEDEAAAAAK